ncbi:MAG: putative transport protein [Rhodothermales bacterium]|jgi:predicted transport protein
MMSTMNDSMKARTGRNVEEWVAVVAKCGIDPLEQNAVRKWLKAQHGVLQNSQWAIADAAARAAGWVEPTLEEYIDRQYAGPKASLRPIFDAVRERAISLGDDVSVEGRSTYVPFVRARQFAAVAAATRTRVDLGLRFATPPESDRLTAKGPGQSTHKVSLTGPEDVTDEVARLLQIA